MASEPLTAYPLRERFSALTATGAPTRSAATEARALFDVTIYPWATGSVSGYPDLGSIDDTDLGARVTVETLVSAAGEVREYRVTSGGTILMDTGSVIPDPSDVLAVTEHDRLLSTANVQIDGASTWSGSVLDAGTAWWHIRPIADLPISIDANPALEPAAEFQTLATFPVQDLVEEGHTQFGEKQ